VNTLVFQALDRAHVGMIIIDRNLKILLWNRWLERFTGYKREDALGRSLLEICPRFQTKTYYDIVQNALQHGHNRFCSSTLHKAFVLPKDVRDADASKQNMHVEPLYDGEGCYALIQISDMTNMYDRVFKLKNLIRDLEVEYNEMKNAERLNRHLAMHDALTELPNRLYFNDRLEWAIGYAQRNGDKLAVMFLDLDGFKEINDAFGHDVGDKVLTEAAHRLRSCIRTSDTIARIGGDEFSVVLSQLKDEADATLIARKFINVLEEPFQAAGQAIRLSVSVGISLYPKDGQEPAELIKKADIAMYKIKNGGKNSFGYISQQA